MSEPQSAELLEDALASAWQEGYKAGQDSVVFPDNPQSNAAIRAEARRDTVAAIRARVEGLPDHTVSGYEWECDECTYRIVGSNGTYFGADERECPHSNYDDAALSRAAVLALLDDLAGDARETKP